MKFDEDKIDFDAGLSKNQSNNLAGADTSKPTLVSLHTGNDTFVFSGDLGAETGLGHNAHAGADELASHPNTQSAQQITALVTSDLHNEAFFDLVHNDGSVLPSGVSQAQWHAVIANGFHLH
jgi:hypothetical protein